MKKFLIFGLILTFVASISMVAQPKIEVVGGDIVDWQDVSPKDNPLVSEVNIKNAGTEKLVIQEVKPTCGCTTAPLDKYELAPGESTSMKVTLNVGSSTGKVHKTIRIASNDPSSAMKIVSLRANVIRPIEIKPTSYFTFNKVAVGSEATSKIFLKNNTSEPIELSDFKAEPDFMQVNLSGKQIIKPGEEIEVIATIKPQKVGYLNASLRMKTSNSETPVLDIRGYGQVEESPIFNSK